VRRTTKPCDQWIQHNKRTTTICRIERIRSVISLVRIHCIIRYYIVHTGQSVSTTTSTDQRRTKGRNRTTDYRYDVKNDSTSTGNWKASQCPVSTVVSCHSIHLYNTYILLWQKRKRNHDKATNDRKLTRYNSFKRRFVCSCIWNYCRVLQHCQPSHVNELYLVRFQSLVALS
jgi:hypothetical protein